MTHLETQIFANQQNLKCKESNLWWCTIHITKLVTFRSKVDKFDLQSCCIRTPSCCSEFILLVVELKMLRHRESLNISHHFRYEENAIDSILTIHRTLCEVLIRHLEYSYLWGLCQCHPWNKKGYVWSTIVSSHPNSWPPHDVLWAQPHTQLLPQLTDDRLAPHTMY